MCCGTRVCCFCMCVILVVMAIGFLFGFGVFKHGFHKLENTIHNSAPSSAAAYGGRPFFVYNAPPPF
ncbi:hypothetical protein ABFS83_08G164200 [Erythranthe nasuta]